MTISKIMHKATRVGLVFTAGMLMQVDFSCTGVGEKIVNNVNPCGTILNCDPVEYDLLTTDFPDYNLDPTCTIPGQCGGVWPGTSGTSTTQ